MIPRRPFGRTGHLSSATLFGGAALARASQDDADRTLDVLLRFGVNHIDTAARYGDSELRIGPWMAHHRKDFFLATKTGSRTAKEARDDIHRSLERLRVDHVDLIQLHSLGQPDAGAVAPRTRRWPRWSSRGDCPRSSGCRPSSRMPLRTIVVGGGIGGLSLARELAKLGLPAVVVERAPKLATVGAGIIMNPNAMSVLEANGLAACVRSRSAPYLARDTSDHRGRWLATRDYRPLYADGRLAVGALLHRSHLHDCLHDGLPPGTVHLDTRIRDLEAGLDGVRVETERGEIYTGDLLVGADGIRSTVRARFFGQHDPVYLGYRSHRFVVANRDGLEHFTEFLGRGQRVGLVPIGGGQLYVWTTFNSPVEGRAWALESVGALQALFGRFTDARVRRAFAELPSTERVVCT